MTTAKKPATATAKVPRPRGPAKPKPPVKKKVNPLDVVTVTKVTARNSIGAVMDYIAQKQRVSYNWADTWIKTIPLSALGAKTVWQIAAEIASRSVVDDTGLTWFDIWNAVENYFEKMAYDKKVKSKG